MVGHTGHILALAVSSDGEFLVSVARIQQKGGGGLVHQGVLTFLAFHCNHIKLNSPKKGGGLNKEGWGATTL